MSHSRNCWVLSCVTKRKLWWPSILMTLELRLPKSCTLLDFWSLCENAKWITQFLEIQIHPASTIQCLSSLSLFLSHQDTCWLTLIFQHFRQPRSKELSVTIQSILARSYKLLSLLLSVIVMGLRLLFKCLCSYVFV